MENELFKHIYEKHDKTTKKMKIINTYHLAGTDHAVKFTGGTSYRALLARNGMGFSLSRTVIPKGGPHHWHYKHHKEACYCVSGHGVVTDMETGRKYDILPGTVYVVGNHEDHEFEAIEDTVLVSVFNPPLTGFESHDADGAYPSSYNGKAAKIVEAVLSTKNDYDAIEKVNKLL